MATNCATKRAAFDMNSLYHLHPPFDHRGLTNYPVFGLANDVLVPSQGISIGETLTSAGQNFELGFFNPLNSSRRYVGIWYKVSPETIVWVANRENPLAAYDQSVKLILNEDGNLKLFDGKKSLVWSTNLSVPLDNSIATLYDTGNFILKDNTTNKIAWESFNQTSDVNLSAMSFQISTKESAKLLMNSWRSANDPSPGNFTLKIIPKIPVQGYIWKGSIIYWRTGPWNSVTFVGIPDLSTAFTDTFSIHVDSRAGILSLSWNNIYDKLSSRIMKLFPDGSLKSFNLQGSEWLVTFAAPDNVCDVYGSCGPLAVCNPNESPKCSCVRGFIPKSAEEWSNGNWTNGCIRRTELLCSKNFTGNLTFEGSDNDRFLKLSRMKLPDVYHYLAAENNNGECQDWCLGNCSCSAFAYVNGIGCLVWTGDLIDLQKFSSTGEDLYVRLAQSELRENSSNDLEESALKTSLEQVDTDELPLFEFEKIVAATNDFSTMNKIGQGGFGKAWTLWNEGRGLELMDEATLEGYSETQVLRCINVGLLCIQDHADDRPTMSNVVVMLSSSETPIPNPRKPAFDPEFRSRSSEHGSVYSVNGVTASVVEGR
ncbi:hypothetical protein V2J09_011438 [Rumex salicifolius]